MLKWPEKDPAERLDYQIDWTKVLAGDTLDGEPEVEASGGLDVESPSTVGNVTTVWISGGDASETTRLDAHVCFLGTTVGGRKIRIKVALPVGTGC